MKLLILSNGHGEDAIAVRIIEQLQRHSRTIQIAALPLVGEGYAYAQLNIPTIGKVQKMPSGGFIYMDGRQLLQDVKGGLLQLTLAQYKAIRKWGQSGGKILAVGDVVPLLFAWLSGTEYAFVGTARSEYYIRDEDGWLPQTSKLERWLGSVYSPLDRWLMARPRCKAVFPRDSLTTTILQQCSIPAFDLGNPMMDGIVKSRKSEGRGQEDILTLTILLLPGSRSPEAERNWQMILTAITEVISSFYVTNFSSRLPIKTNLRFIGAIAPALNLDPFIEHLKEYGWYSQSSESFKIPIADPDALIFTQNNTQLILSQNADSYSDSLQIANLAIAMAGTATEQFVGLGKPVITIPSKGPQFTYAFAEAQSRLLGCSVILVQTPQQVAGAVQSLLQDPDRWQQIKENGPRRMGSFGAGDRIARCLIERLHI
ncbi:hypothetical protein HC931_01385 [Candidatus Gracilibacteria bacterium]|nr:hypothetical protein [Candidatus Gracilibacteria bacterium]NJM86361.1 hypothetical protein [Hydrococcus sp. RU_2_2]NJP19188.1 hypothetical protein [Hydrococcus sp. CRU_1_1]